MIRVCLAKTAIDGLRTRTPEQSARDAVTLMHERTGQTGGLIIVASDGSIGHARTTRVMTWASVQGRRDATDAPNASAPN
ncbi:MAG: hypothetical protein ABIU95_05290, partial [Burkholderiales bacterium]